MKKSIIKIGISKPFFENKLFFGLLFCLMCFVFSSATSQSNTLLFQHFNTKEGLSHQNVVHVFQDSRSFIWIATSDGLNRYDGHIFTTFFHDEDSSVSSVSSNNIKHVIEDKRGKLIVSSDEGVDIYNPINNHWKHIFSPQDFQSKSNRVLSTLLDSRNHLWVLTPYQLFELDSSYNILHNYKDELSGKGIFYNFFKDHIGNIWVNRSGTLNKIDTRRQTIENQQYNSSNLDIFRLPQSALTFDANNFIWSVSPEHYLLQYNNTGKEINKIPIDPSLLLLGITMDKQEKIWVATLGQGLWCYSIPQKKWQKFLHNSDVPSSVCKNTINGVFQDNQDNIWVYTDEGLDVIPSSSLPLTLVSKFGNKYDQSSADFEITNLIKFQRKIWLSTWGMGLISQDTPQLHTAIYSTGKKTIENMVWDLLPFNNEIWYGNYNGLHVFNPVKKIKRDFLSNPTYPIRKDSIAAFGLFKDRNHQVWISLLGGEGILKYDSITGTFKHFSSVKKDKEYFPLPHYDAITEDERGLIWMGSNRIKGLVFYDPKTDCFQILTNHGKPVFNDLINCLIPFKNILWIGSNSGLYKLNLLDYSIKKFTRKEGLLNDNINTLVIDKNKELWIGTSNGLSKLNSAERFSHFTVPYDLPEAQILNSLMDDTDGRLYFITPHSYFVIQPNQLSNGNRVLNPQLISFSADGKPQYPEYNNSYNLNAANHFFSIEYTAPYFPSADKVQYAYFLEGYDKDWIYAGNRNHVDYTNLPYGKYIFRVKASIDGFHWYEMSSSASIFLHQPFYLHSWFMAVLLSLLLLITLLILYLKYRIKFNKILFGQKIREKIAEDIHDDISSGLTKISWMNEIMKTRLQQQDYDQAKEILEQMVGTTKETMSKLGEIIWSSNPNHDNLEAFMSYLRNHIAVFFENSQSKVTLNFPEDIEYIPMNPDLIRQLYLIVNESLHNVMKYANAENVNVDFFLQGNQFQLRIMDDGIGFASHEKKGSGNGIVNMKKRADVIQATLTIETQPGKGTIVVVVGKIF